MTFTKSNQHNIMREKRKRQKFASKRCLNDVRARQSRFELLEAFRVVLSFEESAGVVDGGVLLDLLCCSKEIEGKFLSDVTNVIRKFWNLNTNFDVQFC